MQPILPTGDRLTEDAENSSFRDRNRSVSWLISVNGNNAFSAHAQFHDIEASSDGGKKAIVWETGAITHLPCKAAANSGPSTAKYLELAGQLTAAARTSAPLITRSGAPCPVSGYGPAGVIMMDPRRVGG
ncbi:hypothetical protein [Streptomyces anulatus]|uniref:hypothetical protein n=1 Tax=Streptomyces anulatus TaxID=1892 RepID=UPI00131F05F0|nr:hypothetical protein [Streptomyces anulatus]